MKSAKRLAQTLAACGVSALLVLGGGASPAAADAVPSDWMPEASYAFAFRNPGPLEEVYWIGSGDHVVYHDYQTKVGGPTVRGSLGGQAKGSPARAWNVFGQSHVFVRGSDNQIYVRWQWDAGRPEKYNDDWYPMNELPGGATSNPDAVRDENGLIEVFARGSDNGIWTIWQNEPGGSWSDWAPLDGDCVSRPVANFSGTTVKVFCYGTNSKRYYKSRARVGAGWTSWMLG